MTTRGSRSVSKHRRIQPYAWLGSGWQGCSAAGPGPFPPALLADYGIPVANVTEVSAGVFERRWSKALARFDCNAYTGEVVMGQMA